MADLKIIEMDGEKHVLIALSLDEAKRLYTTLQDGVSGEVLEDIELWKFYELMNAHIGVLEGMPTHHEWLEAQFDEGEDPEEDDGEDGKKT